MIFRPQIYNIPDVANVPFIDSSEIEQLVAVETEPSIEQVREVIARSLNNERLSMQDTALLIRARSTEAVGEILSAARELKKRVYGNRIVLFAPLYVGNSCVNNCSYCGFRATNAEQVRRTLSNEELIREVEEIEQSGHKRVILVFGEHPRYSAQYIADSVRTVYGVKCGNGEIRRININAAPLEVDGFRTVKQSGIGTYQIFQETYNLEAYKKYHISGPKSDYEYRLTAMDRAMEAGIDDVGLGVLLGLSDWRFELLSLIRHTNHLEACYNVGPHTISFPRIKNASSLDRAQISEVCDEDFIRIVSILRLAVPYAGLILTARESAELRSKLIEFGVSQIDAGSHLEIGGYQNAAAKPSQNIHKEQFELGDSRSLAEVIEELTERGNIPSFCTACYRKGRTGEHFMEFSTKGFIKHFCSSNAILTFAEYLENYTSGDTYVRGHQMILRELAALDPTLRAKTKERLEMIKSGSHDQLF